MAEILELLKQTLSPTPVAGIIFVSLLLVIIGIVLTFRYVVLPAIEIFKQAIINTEEAVQELREIKNRLVNIEQLLGRCYYDR